MSYNGWINRETWNASLWLNNEEAWHHRAYEIANNPRHIKQLKAKILEDYCRVIWANQKTPDGDDLDAVVWEDVMSGLME